MHRKYEYSSQKSLQLHMFMFNEVDAALNCTPEHTVYNNYRREREWSVVSYVTIAQTKRKSQMGLHLAVVLCVRVSTKITVALAPNSVGISESGHSMQFYYCFASYIMSFCLVENRNIGASLPCNRRRLLFRPQSIVWKLFIPFKCVSHERDADTCEVQAHCTPLIHPHFGI